MQARTCFPRADQICALKCNSSLGSVLLGADSSIHEAYQKEITEAGNLVGSN